MRYGSTCWKVPSIGPERGKLREVNPVCAINTDEEKSGSVALRPVEIPPSIAYGAFPRILSGTSCVPGHWEAKSSAVLCLDAIPQVGQMSPGVGLHYSKTA